MLRLTCSSLQSRPEPDVLRVCRSKWAISWNNLKDLNKPLEKVSAAQMTALTGDPGPPFLVHAS